ncbi:uncharacterized protein LOC144119816 [Amblyomma americanum]
MDHYFILLAKSYIHFIWKRIEDLTKHFIFQSKLNFQARALAKRSAEDELMEQTSEMEGTEGTSKAVSLQSKVADLEVRVKELESLNKELQKALCAKVLNMDSCVMECGLWQPSSHRAQPGPPRAAVPGHASWVPSQCAHGSSASQAKPSSPLPQLAVDPAPFPDVSPADEARLPKDSFRYYLMLKGCSAEELSKRHKKVVRSESEQRRLQHLLQVEELGAHEPTALLRRILHLAANHSPSVDASLPREMFLQRLLSTCA